MDLLVEKGDSRTYLSSYKVITTSFEESPPSVKRNNTQIQYRNGNVDFGGWHEAKKIDYVGYYRADDIDEEETLREKIYALLSDPDGYYITQLKNDSDNSYERPGENTGDYFEKQVNRPSHKRFYVYASSLKSELVGSYGGHVLYKISATFTTMKLPYGESVPRDLDVKPNVPYYGRNLIIRTGELANTMVDTDGDIAARHGSALMADKITVTPGETLTFSRWGDNNHGDNYFRYGLYTDTDRLVIRQASNDYHFTIIVPANATNLKVSYPVSSQVKLEKGSVATPWSPAPEDPGYNKWHFDTYYKIKNLVIPYAGTVTCNQLEQGFTIEFTAKEAGTGLSVYLDWTKLTYSGQINSGDIFKFSGYEYTKNGISIVKDTNKAYFKLFPGIANKISSNLHGSIKILGFQDLYA